MAEMDALELRITGDAQKAVASIDSIIKKLNQLSGALNIDISKLGNIGKNLNFGEISNGAKAMVDNVSKSTAKVVESMKPVEAEVKKTTQMLSDMSSAQMDEWFKNLPTQKAQAEELNRTVETIAQNAEETAREFTGAWNGVEIPKELLTSANEFSQELNKNTKDIDVIIDQLREKFKNVGMNFVFKGNAEQLTKEINKTVATLDRLYEKQDKMVSLGKVDTAGFGSLQYDISEAHNKLEILQNTVAEAEKNVEKSSFSWSAFGKTINQVFSGISKVLQKVNKTISGVLSRIGKLTKSMFSLNGAAKKTNTSFSKNLMTILKYTLGIRSLYVLFNRIRRAIKEGIKNLVQYSDRVNASVSLMSNSIMQFKNSIAAMIAPLLNAFAPTLNQIIQLCIRATNAINQLFSALTGSGTWIRAKELTDNYADSLKSAAEAAKTMTLGIDELNIIGDQNNGGAGSVTSAEDMFETLAVESKFEQLAEKIKNIANQIFEPFRTAWENQGKFVINSWKYSLEEIGILSKNVGADFLSVWNQPSSISALENILTVIGDIGIVVGNLAGNFRRAWGENKAGKAILENIRDIFAVITEKVRSMADYTVEWSSSIDFSPLLESFERLTESLEPAADSISGALSDFYEQVLLPLGKWTIEEGLPDLIDVFTDFANNVDWEKLRSNLSELWTHLQPFMENVGEGLIIFVDRISDSVANFVNSEGFSNFLKDLGEWMDSVSAEDVADSIKNIAIAIAALEVAPAVLTSISALLANLKALKAFGKIAIVVAVAVEGFELGKEIGKALFPEDIEVYANFKWMGEGGFFDEVFSDIGSAFDGFVNMVTDFENNPIIAGFSTAMITLFTGGLGTAAIYIWKYKDDIANGFDAIVGKINEFTSSFTAGTWLEALSLWGSDIKEAFGLIGEAITEWWNGVVEWWNNSAISVWWEESVVPWFTVEKWKTLLNNVKVSFQTKWNEISTQWKTNLSTWWNTNVIPWFTATRWISAMSGIKESFKQTFKNAANIAIEIFNKLINWINEKMHFEWDAIEIAGIEVVPAGSVQLFTIPTIPRFKMGGFPEDGLFYKNNDEIITQVAGRTQVLNSADTYDMIRSAAYEGQMQAQNELIRYLSEIAQNTRETADKDMSVNISDRDIARANQRGIKEIGRLLVT